MLLRVLSSVALTMLAVSLGADDRAELDRILAQVKAGENAAAEIGIEDVLDVLPAGSGLIAFTVFAHGVGGDDDTNRESYGLFVLPLRDADPIFERLGDGEALDRMISRWRDRLRQPASGEAACRAAGEPVRLTTWDPFASRFTRTSRLFVIPDGIFNLVNLVALPTADGRYLVETGPQLHSLTSERDLVSATAPPPAGKGLLALGGVSFDADPTGGLKEGETSGAFRGALPTCANFRSIHFEPLPAFGWKLSTTSV